MTDTLFPVWHLLCPIIGLSDYTYETLANYYYLLRVPDARLPFQGIGPPISADWWQAGCPGSWPEDKVYHGVNLLQPVFLAVLMGDLNGVMIGQEVHRNMLLRNDVFHPEEEVIYGAPAPSSKTWAGIYIDDFGVGSGL